MTFVAKLPGAESRRHRLSVSASLRRSLFLVPSIPFHSFGIAADVSCKERGVEMERVVRAQVGFLLDLFQLRKESVRQGIGNPNHLLVYGVLLSYFQAFLQRFLSFAWWDLYSRFWFCKVAPGALDCNRGNKRKNPVRPVLVWIQSVQRKCLYSSRIGGLV